MLVNFYNSLKLSENDMARIISIISGKSGVGRTNFSLNLALYLAGQEYRTCLFDADMGLANINNPMGIYPELDLEDLIVSSTSLDDFIINNYKGIDIIPGNYGVEMLGELEPDQKNFLLRSFSKLEDYDFILIDLPAGAPRNVILFSMASSETILMATPEPSSLSAAHEVLKILSKNGFKNSAMLVVNQSKSIQNARGAYTTLKESVQKSLNLNILPLGTIIQDPQVFEAVRVNKPFISHFPDSKASKCIVNIAKNLVKKKTEDIETYTFETFWKRYFKLMESPLQLGGIKTEKKPKSDARQPRRSAAEGLRPPVLDKPPPTEAAANPEIAEKGLSAQEIYHFLNTLIEKISSISSELGEIRKIIKDGRVLNPGTKAPSNDIKDNDAEIIVLDIEEFLKQRKSK